LCKTIIRGERLIPQTSTDNTARPGPVTSIGIRIGFWLCIAVGVAVVGRRVVALRQASAAVSSAPPELARLDAWFRSHATLTYAHILIALVFICLLPLMFWERTRRLAAVHWVHYALGATVALTAYAMSAYSVGGWIERSAVLLFDTLFLVCLGKSLRAWRAGDRMGEWRWTLRSTATVLGIATTRPVMGVFFATSQRTHWTPQQFFGPAFWIGFSINVFVMEVWLRRNPLTRKAGTPPMRAGEDVVHGR